jgi:hypothetical protein
MDKIKIFDSNGSLFMKCSEKRALKLEEEELIRPIDKAKRNFKIFSSKEKNIETDLFNLPKQFNENTKCNVCGSKNDILYIHIVPEILRKEFEKKSILKIEICEKCNLKYQNLNFFYLKFLKDEFDISNVKKDLLKRLKSSDLNLNKIEEEYKIKIKNIDYFIKDLKNTEDFKWSYIVKTFESNRNLEKFWFDFFKEHMKPKFLDIEF